MTEIQRGRVQKLVGALRSGAYERGEGQLRDGQKFCPLGVACNIYRYEDGIDTSRWDEEKFVISNEDGTETWEQDVLPLPVAVWFGFDGERPRQDPILKTEPREYFGTLEPCGLTVTELNDSGTPFSEIADLFEAKYLKDVE